MTTQDRLAPRASLDDIFGTAAAEQKARQEFDRWERQPHWLVVSEQTPDYDCGSDALTVEHPTGCPGIENDYGCGVSEISHAVGLRYLFRHRDEPGIERHDHAVPLAPGRHAIRSWHTGPDHNGEYDGGINLIDAANTPV